MKPVLSLKDHCEAAFKAVRILVYSLFVTMIVSCYHENDSTDEDTVVEHAVKHFDEKSETLYKEYKYDENQNNTEIVLGKIDFEKLLWFDHSDAVEILPVGMFHGADIPPEFFLKTWFGLYTGENGSQLRKVEVDFSPAFDPIMDMQGQMSAIKVQLTGDTLQPVVLISGVERHVGECPQFVLSNSRGSQLSLPHIFEPGHHLFLADKQDAKYMLKIHGEENQQNVIELINRNSGASQIIAGAEELDDARLDIRWAGDLNGDSIPDLLLNIAPKYSYAHWALYLSDPNGDQLLMPIADLIFTSC